MNNLTKFNLRNENTRGSKPVAREQLVGGAKKVFKTKILTKIQFNIFLMRLSLFLTSILIIVPSPFGVATYYLGRT
jgi:hypothetical protein